MAKIDDELKARDEALNALVYALMQRFPPRDQRAVHEDLLTLRKTAADNGAKLEAKLIGDLCAAIEIYLPQSEH
jgi:hypothetical protein